jgi:hypothetical protein
MIPKFCLDEEMSGDVTIRFTDRVDDSIYFYLYEEIDKRVETFNEEERDVYHLEKLVGGLLSNAIVQKRLCKDRCTNKWFVLEK